MSNRLFQDELSYLRDVGRELARQNPKLARYLSERGTDPEVERLLEGFAFLTARVRGEIDDEMSDFTHSVISLLWPNFLRPFPSTTMMKFYPRDRSITERQVLSAGSTILSHPIDEVHCSFQTTTDCPIYPMEVEDAQLERTRESSRLRVSFKTLSGLPLKRISLDDLRLTFSGDVNTRQMLYLWIGRYIRKASIVFGDGTRRMLNPERHIKAIGFSVDEAILPQQTHEFEGHRLLQEYYVFPDKFYGYDLKELQPIFSGRDDADFTLELEFSRSFPVEYRINASTIRLYCVPAINLFPHQAEPIFIRDDRVYYRLEPAGVHANDVEIFSIDSVHTPQTGEESRSRSKSYEYPPYESFSHQARGMQDMRQIYYRLKRCNSLHSKNFDYELFFVHHNNEAGLPEESTLAVDLTCFNSELPQKIGVGDVNISTDSMPSFIGYDNISVPTEVVYPPLDGRFNWQLISNLAPNYTSLLNRDAVAAILSAYDYTSFSDRQAERASKARIDAIRSFSTVPMDRLFSGRPIRGLKSSMSIRESAFETEGELYLFTSLLAEFFSLYATINSFHELEIKHEESGAVYNWPPRVGRQPLI